MTEKYIQIVGTKPLNEAVKKNVADIVRHAHQISKMQERETPVQRLNKLFKEERTQ